MEADRTGQDRTIQDRTGQDGCTAREGRTRADRQTRQQQTGLACRGPGQVPPYTGPAGGGAARDTGRENDKASSRHSGQASGRAAVRTPSSGEASGCRTASSRPWRTCSEPVMASALLLGAACGIAAGTGACQITQRAGGQQPWQISEQTMCRRERALLRLPLATSAATTAAATTDYRAAARPRAHSTNYLSFPRHRSIASFALQTAAQRHGCSGPRRRGCCE